MITGRGLVLALAGQTHLSVGKQHTVTITRPDGTVLRVEAFKEWLLKRNPTVHEQETLLLTGATKDDVPIGSLVTVGVEKT